MLSLRFYIALCFLACGTAAQNDSSLPNIIFIIADDLGWNDVGFHGSNQIPTPNIDALAYRGVILNNYYVQPLCTPSRCALMTGKYPIHTGMQHYVILNQEPRGLPLSEKLIPQYLKNLGYATHAIGKWHLGFYKKEYTPEHRGFDSYIGHWTGVLDYYDHSGTEKELWGLDIHQGLDPLWDLHGKYLTEFYTEEAVKTISHHAKTNKIAEESGNSTKPLFLYLAQIAVHSGNPYNPLPAPDETVDKFSYIKNYKRRRYAAMLHWLDKSVGDVVEALAENKMLDNSIIVFTTDNGGAPAGLNDNFASNWPLRGAKFTLWEGGTRGAAAVWSPRLKKRGRVSNHLMHITDWLPTLLSAVNATDEIRTNIDGFDLWDTLSEDKPSNRSEVLLNIDAKDSVAALRVGEWKVIIGNSLNGSRNSWYSPIHSDYEDNNGLILTSKVSKAMDSIGYPLTEEQILSSRKEAIVICEPENLPDDIKESKILCDAHLKPCLFNIISDPCEKRNLAEIYPKKLEEMLHILDRYNSTALPPSNTHLDPNSHPRLWDYAWTNFGDKTPPSKKDTEKCNDDL
ncbi:hypothetical protein J437_LFUL006743 [Ladona fulva]|uniref:Sulfatase N-terminal domain-containing protein n=1 Tax=Ladona fulva TaxID=123851 RepID=A0A8K0NYE6_LADFU|nr:hypothetical protein J437_LFUL006743 [Ladona fulva]